ncbi:hypothetical protein GS448_25920 [Rhodococcus hoagii]|nr:hypothetical protein [Prescottella equi]MBM4653969.1 hypothetical protein [Prescottella equi]MBM4670343.1 hypothetical protein [Prescottella equi]MBM4719765.1 hypothetical protein [Prescottella equi]NKR23565.1 hypothetical protein [Prescottella equi]
MPNRTHLIAVARRLKKELNGRAFRTIERTTITSYVREESGEPTTRVKKAIAADLTTTLIAQGVQVYPPLTETTTGDTVRLYHAGSVLGQLIDTIVYPDQSRDDELGDMLTKIKGKWQWAPAEALDTTGAAAQPITTV